MYDINKYINRRMLLNACILHLLIRLKKGSQIDPNFGGKIKITLPADAATTFVFPALTPSSKITCNKEKFL